MKFELTSPKGEKFELTAPDDAIWHRYLWTRDYDAQGQRVYVGGTDNGHGLEIHRHLHLDERFAVPLFPRLLI